MKFACIYNAQRQETLENPALSCKPIARNISPNATASPTHRRTLSCTDDVPIPSTPPGVPKPTVVETMPASSLRRRRAETNSRLPDAPCTATQRPQASHTSHEQPTHVETSARGVSLNANAYPNPTATPTVGCKPVASNFPKNAHPILNF